MKEQFTFFWDGPFSQWHSCEFTDSWGLTYNCAEQYMMASKAELCDDKETMRKIMKATSPNEQKALGRTVKNFDVDQWNEVARDIVYEGNDLKFNQNPELKQMLLETTGTTLVEASPVDSFWGIALYANDSRALSRSTWQGTNWLGEVLTNVRDDMIKRTL